MTSTVCVESHLAPRTPLHPTTSKIHTNIYSVPAWGLGHWAGMGGMGTLGLDKQLPGKSRARMGSAQMPGPWGLVQFLEVKESRWAGGGQFPPNQAQARLESGILVAIVAPADCSCPHPPSPGGKAAPGSCSSRWGKTTMQVIRFKLKIIKITIKKDNPCPNKPMTSLPGPLDTLAGEGGRNRWSAYKGHCWGHKQGPGRWSQPPLSAAAVSKKQ